MQREEWSSHVSSAESPVFQTIGPVKSERDDKEQDIGNDKNEDEERTEREDDVPKKRSKIKRKRILTISDKINILYRLEGGASSGDVAREYGISNSAISKIKKKKSVYLSKTSNQVSMQQKNLRLTRNPALEDMTYAWLCQQVCSGEPINGPILCEKALELNYKINGPASFKASNGWLHRFKRRHGIRNLVPQNEIISSYAISSDQFVKDFKRYLEINGYLATNVYNADETGLNWKSLPREAVSPPESAYERKREDRATVVYCANATGSHRVPALVVGNQERYKCFTGTVCLPIVYKYRSDALMDRQLFTDWYTNHFISAVRQEQEKTGTKGKVLLLLDTAPCHLSVPILNSIDEEFSVMHLPPLMTAALQPMNQGIIESAKSQYRKTLTIRLLMSQNIGVDKFLDALTIKDCCEMIASSWQSVPSSILSKTWESLLPEGMIVRDHELACLTSNVIPGDLASTLNQIDHFNVTESDVVTWLNEDNGVNGWAPLTDEQLIAEVIGTATFGVPVFIKGEPDCEVIEAGEEEEEEEEEHYTAQDALGAIDIVYNWYKKQATCNLNDLTILNKIRNTAMDKVLKDK